MQKLAGWLAIGSMSAICILGGFGSNLTFGPIGVLGFLGFVLINVTMVSYNHRKTKEDIISACAILLHPINQEKVASTQLPADQAQTPHAGGWAFSCPGCGQFIQVEMSGDETIDRNELHVAMLLHSRCGMSSHNNKESH